jgi:hypothetical protein
MRRSICIVSVCLLLVAGPAMAQTKHPADRTVLPGALPAGPIITSVEYSLVLLASGLSSIRGLGVPPPAGRIFVDDYGGEVYLYQNGSFDPTGIGDEPFSGRYFKGYYFGDYYGNIFKLVNGKAKHLASMPGSLISALAVDPANGCVYFATTWESMGIYKLRKGSSKPKLLLSIPFDCYGLALRGDALYISDYDSGNIYRMPKRGGSLRLLYSGLSGPCDLIFDQGGNLYIAEWNGGRVMAVKAGTADPVAIAEGFGYLFGIDLDKYGNVYFTEDDGGRLWMLQKSFK